MCMHCRILSQQKIIFELFRRSDKVFSLTNWSFSYITHKAYFQVPYDGHNLSNAV